MSVIDHLETSQGAAAGVADSMPPPGLFLSKLVNPIVIALGRRTVLVVRGRTSGKLVKMPMDPPFEWDGTRYLVSPRGETHWARNLRAAGEGNCARGVLSNTFAWMRSRVMSATRWSRATRARSPATVSATCRSIRTRPITRSSGSSRGWWRQTLPLDA